jgi:hypothetical protein
MAPGTDVRVPIGTSSRSEADLLRTAKSERPKSPRRPRNTKTWPQNGLAASAVCTMAARPSKPLRMSVWPATSHTRVFASRADHGRLRKRVEDAAKAFGINLTVQPHAGVVDLDLDQARWASRRGSRPRRPRLLRGLQLSPIDGHGQQRCRQQAALRLVLVDPFAHQVRVDPVRQINSGPPMRLASGIARQPSACARAHRPACHCCTAAQPQSPDLTQIAWVHLTRAHCTGGPVSGPGARERLDERVGTQPIVGCRTVVLRLGRACLRRIRIRRILSKLLCQARRRTFRGATDPAHPRHSAAARRCSAPPVSLLRSAPHSKGIPAALMTLLHLAKSDLISAA